MDDEELGNEMITAQDYKKKLSYQSSRVRCTFVACLHSNAKALPLPANNALAITEGNTRETALELCSHRNQFHTGYNHPVNLVSDVP